MTSPLALLHDTYYHIYNRGINRETIFPEPRNYPYFLHLYARHLSGVVETYAYCLLGNHFHLLIRTRSEEEMQGQAGRLTPSRAFSNLFNAYAKTINKIYGRTGSLFQHPFGRSVITSDGYFWNAIAYIHQNPQKHHLAQDFRQWKWSSYHDILSDTPSFVARQTVLDWFGGRQQYEELHTQWAEDAKTKWLARDDGD